MNLFIWHEIMKARISQQVRWQKSAVIKVDYIGNFEVFSINICHRKLIAYQHSDFISIYETRYIVKAMLF